MEGAKRDGFQDEHVQRALQKIDLFAHTQML
jgi:hypothetical protein